MANVLGIQAQYYKMGYKGLKVKVTKSTYLLWKAYKLGCEDRKKGLSSRIVEFHETKLFKNYEKQDSDNSRTK